ncbi:hypothetical protein [Rhizobium leguminosarum]|uniref:hypothetical protein n=1 Tax=Rhizobium leguminosarum TaxID=384 RepID=UPI001C94707B|nr:hypothetical protein [Rhizobium leguminosarum]
MTQATIYSVPLVGPATPTAMAQRIDDNFDAIISGHSGSSRPSYAVAGTQWQDTSVAGTVKYYHYDGSNDRLLMTVNTSTGKIAFGDGSDEAYRGHLVGLTLSNNLSDASNDIDIAAGSSASDGTTPALMTLASAITKRLDAAWAVGTGNGGRMSAAAIADGTYHVWEIGRSDTGVVDVGFDVSATAPTMPANYDRKRRIGSIMRVSGSIVPFIQTGDIFARAVRIQDVFATNPGTSAVTRTLSVPTGIGVFPFGTIQIEITTASAITVSCLLTDLAQPDSDPATVGGHVTFTTLTAGGSQRGFSYFGNIKTNTSAQLRSRFNNSGPATNFFLHTDGWVDTRGRT